jgi:anaerobic selenocysteine-containing dehydrogenase
MTITVQNLKKSESLPTACILCSVNCGLTVSTHDGQMTKIKGDKNHPTSKGYLCQKAARLNYYQNNPKRLTTPLKRTASGDFQEIPWDQAISEIALKINEIRNNHGGHALAYYGGGGQGNHMGGAHSSTLRATMGTRYLYTSLAQEKTGGFWVNGRLFGRQTCHPSEDVHNSDYLLVIGTNPWQSHGFPRARKVLEEISKDPQRTMVVVDPRRTETAKRADIYWPIKPGTDSQLMLAMLAIMVQEDLVNHKFLEQWTTGYTEIQTTLKAIPINQYIEATGLDSDSIHKVTRDFAKAKAGCVRTDLGLEHSVNSTLNTYLSKLLYLLTGQFGKKGTVNLHSAFVPLIGHSKESNQGARKTQVTGMHEISKFYPPNILPLEIDTDHPDRLRAVIVDSANPLLTAADSSAYEKAFNKLELLVCIDVAHTETAQLAHYILPTSTQFEKWEATFFNIEFPSNFFHLRKPLFDAPKSVLTEQEIYRRIAVAAGTLPNRFPILEKIAKLDRRFPKLKLFPIALGAFLKLNPKLKPYLAVILHQTLGKAMPDGANVAAILWGASHMYVKQYGKAPIERAGIADTGQGLAEALFQKILNAHSGTLISTHLYEDTFKFLEYHDKKIHLQIPELVKQINELTLPKKNTEFPYILMAGERRSYNANTIIRQESWRKLDQHGSLKMHPEDAEKEGFTSDSILTIHSQTGQIQARLEIDPTILPGVISLPHGYGMGNPENTNDQQQVGPLINRLTSSTHCDSIAKTPFHKFIPVNVSRTEKSLAL